MLAYVIRRIAYAVPILIGVNLITFFLFFYVNKPEDMAKTVLGDKRVTQEQVDQWLREHGYHLPVLVNREAPGLEKLTQTIFWQKSIPLFYFQFGKSDLDDKRIGDEILRRIPPSLGITLPIFVMGLFLGLFFSMVVAFYRGTYLDFIGLIVSVLILSISTLFYIIGGQFLIARYLRLVPISGFDTGLYGVKFYVLPVIIGVVAGLGGSVRYYRTIFLEEINRDYVRTARAKGLGEGKVLFKHALKNAMIPILTNVVVSIPFLITGSLLFENFFAIPGLGSYTVDAINSQNFAVVRAMVYLGSFLYIIGLILVDISYTLVDPRIRLG